MRCPDKRVVAVTSAILLILIVTGASVLNGINLFGSKTVQKDNDQTTFKESPNSSSNNLHIVITGSVVGIILLIIAMIAIRILASRDKRQEELTNRARMEPNIQPHIQAPQWFPTAPIQQPQIPQIPQVNQDYMYNQYRQPAQHGNPPSIQIDIFQCRDLRWMPLKGCV